MPDALSRWSTSSGVPASAPAPGDPAPAYWFPATWLTRARPETRARCRTLRVGASAAAGDSGAAGGPAAAGDAEFAHEIPAVQTRPATALAKAIASAHLLFSSCGSHPNDAARVNHKQHPNVAAVPTSVTDNRAGRDIPPP
ncbi:hypothetical protein [Streptomyces sp. NPDC097981]|uniref:hypothetical protein n=1 Tax=Streptomyces sp. NPDC097981 TaxID=3155428 RepID=UPI00331FD236